MRNQIEMEKYAAKIKTLLNELIQGKRYDEAKNIINEYESIICDDAEIKSILATIDYQQGNIEQAAEILKESLNINSNFFDSLYNLGYIYHEKGYLESALYFFKRALQEMPCQNQYDSDIQTHINQLEEQLEEFNKKRYTSKSVLVSIVILAYNQLEYTKLCVDSLYKYTPHIEFELITVDNGSSDGTKEYFEWLPNTKKVHFSENVGGARALNGGVSRADGEYLVFLSNDLIVTSHWLDNLLSCIKSDPQIGMVVPACSASSNFQQVNLEYKSIAEMQCIARQYNVSNANKWEERIRLITYGYITRTKLFFEVGQVETAYSQGGFDDDDFSFKMRRKGYKLIFAKDTFWHHFGSVTISMDYKKHNLLERNRKIFFNKFGVDAWDDANFNPEILEVINYPPNPQNIKILGIGNSCGANILQIKNSLREKGVYNVELYYITTQERYLIDLQTVCNNVFCGQDKIELLNNSKFDYIIVDGLLEEHISSYDKGTLFFEQVSKIVEKEGQVIFYSTNPSYYINLVNLLNGNINGIQNDFVLQNFNSNKLIEELKKIGYENVIRYNLISDIPEEHKTIIEKLKSISTFANEKEAEKLLVSKFLYTLSDFKLKRNFSIYPGYDAWLDNVLLNDKNIGNFLGVDIGKSSIDHLTEELNNRGYRLNTIDKNEICDTDFIMFFDAPKSYKNPVFKANYHHVYKGQYYFNEMKKAIVQPKKLLILFESPFIMPENYDCELHETFDYIFTWNDDLVDGIKYFKFNFSQPDNLVNPFIHQFSEKKLCTLVAGNKSSEISGELYSERLKAINFFENKQGNDFDFYGNGWEQSKYKNYKGKIEGKLPVMSKYRFAICYENGVMNGYITEKIFDCFFSRCVPVYLGAPNISDYIPANTFIDRREFDSYEDLYIFLSTMNETDYNAYINNIDDFLKGEQYKQFTHEGFARNILKVIDI